MKFSTTDSNDGVRAQASTLMKCHALIVASAHARCVNKRVALIGEPLRCPPHQRYAATYQWRRVAQEGQLPSDNGKRTSEEQIPHRLDRVFARCFSPKNQIFMETACLLKADSCTPTDD